MGSNRTDEPLNGEEGTMGERVRLLLADALPLFRDGVRALLQGEFSVVGAVGTGPEAVAEARHSRPDLVLMDAALPGLNGVDAARIIRSEVPEAKVVILTGATDEKTVTQCLEAEVHGYVVKDVETADLKKHLRAVLRGEYVLDPKVAGMVMARLRGALPLSESGAPSVPAHGLAPQQLTILRLIALGYSNRAIADQLHLSENTVKGYASDVLQRIGVKNRVEAAMLAVQRGWV
jgi:DNA-binding NarL/FixJ family response regulator